MTKKIILVVDDEPYIIRTIQKTLEKEGYEVVTASDGCEALLKVKNMKPALVLLDINMPGLSGIDTLRCIKALDKNFLVSMVTAVRDEKEAKETIEAGAYDYITKPIDFEHLKSSVFSKIFLIRQA